jgi:serine/threonine protein kinase
MSSLRQSTPRGVDPMTAVGAHSGGGDMLSEFHELAVLGCGAYGRAVKARWAVTGEVVVVKRVRIDLMEPMEREQAAREVATMQLLDHPNCIKYRTSFVQDGSLYIVMEHATVRHLPLPASPPPSLAIWNSSAFRHFCPRHACSSSLSHSQAPYTCTELKIFRPSEALRQVHH